MTRFTMTFALLAATAMPSAAQPPAPPPAPLPPQAAPPAPPAPPVPARPGPLAAPAPVSPFDGFDLDWRRSFDVNVENLRNLPMHLPDLSNLDVHVPDLSTMHVNLQDLEAELADLHVDLQSLHLNMPNPFALTSRGDWTLAQNEQGQLEAAQAAAERAAEAAERAQERTWFEYALRGGDAYNAGLDALQRRQYERAIEAFDRIVQAKGTRVDAALYWKAFSEFKLARTQAALATIEQLRKGHAQSRYLNDAKVLEAEARDQSGQTVDPAQLDDDEIKLLAIQGLQRSEQAVPLLEGVLNSVNSLNVKRRALYVLALSSDTRARDILLSYARGAGNPDLQLEAVHLLVSRRDSQTTGAVLRDLYTSSSDSAVRRTIVDAFRLRSRNGTSDSSPLAGSANQDLAALYQRETDADLRRYIAGVMAANGAVDQVVGLIRTEQDARTRARLISSLNLRNNAEASRALVSLYGTAGDAETRQAIIGALAAQQNAEALIGLARSESNVELKTRIVRHLSEMAPKSKAAADYLMEVIR